MNDLGLIKKYFKSRNQMSLGLFEFGIDDVRFDCFFVNPYTKRIRIFEFKTSRSDYFNDVKKEKWKKYLKYCDTFSFVCPKGLIQKEEVESPAGLLWITTWKEKYQRNFGGDDPAPEWKKRPKRLGLISQEDYDRIIMLLVYRVKFRKDDFF